MTALVLTSGCSGHGRDAGMAPPPDAAPSADGGTPPPGDGGQMPCVGCRSDGQSCGASIECQTGRICNGQLEDLFDPAQTPNVCVKVLCSSDAECMAPKTCSIAHVCQAPSCWSDGACPMGQVCLGGQCSMPARQEYAVRCEIVTPNAALRPGSTFPLSAAVYDTNGSALAGIVLSWSTTSTGVVAIQDAGHAVGGPRPGTAKLTAKVAGSGVACDGQIQVVNIGGAAASFTFVASDTYEPISGAAVTIYPGAETLTTDATGTVQIGGLSSIESVTIVKSGFVSVSIVSLDPSGFYEVAVPREPDPTMAAGFTGAADVSKTRLNEIAIGFAGTALSSNEVDLGLRRMLCESTVEIIDSNAVNMAAQPTNVPAGGVIMIGTDPVTVSIGQKSDRCRMLPGMGHVGCFDAPSPPGQGPAWILAGQMSIAHALSLNMLGTSAICDGVGGYLPYSVLSFARLMWHGAVRSVRFPPSPRIDRPGSMADCSSIATPNYDAFCQGDFSMYTPLDMMVDGPVETYAEVQVQPLPRRYGGGPCLGQILVIASESLPTAGAIPIGFGGGTSDAGCVASSPAKPFGDTGVTLPPGTLPLAFAHPHGAIDRPIDPSLTVTALALDQPGFSATKPFIMAAASSAPTSSIATSVRLPPFIGFPNATIDTTAMQVQLIPPAGADIIELELRVAGKTWIVYAPGSASMVSLPNVAAAHVPLRNRPDLKVFLRGIALARPAPGNYGGYFDFTGPAYFNSAERAFSAFSVRECRAQDLDCTIR